MHPNDMCTGSSNGKRNNAQQLNTGYIINGVPLTIAQISNE